MTITKILLPLLEYLSGMPLLNDQHDNQLILELQRLQMLKEEYKTQIEHRNSPWMALWMNLFRSAQLF